MKNFGIGCLTVIILFIFWPIICFVGGYIAGTILEWFVGDAVVNGLNVLFGTTRFAKDLLPIVCGALSIVGSYFKVGTSVSKSE